jgi:hypothetical protein
MLCCVADGNFDVLLRNNTYRRVVFLDIELERSHIIYP